VLPLAAQSTSAPSHPAPAAAQQPTSVRQADAVCARCHQQIYQHYIQTSMANASGMANQRLDFGTFNDSRSHVDYAITNLNGKPVLSWKDLSEPGQSGHRDLIYFFGSGHLGTTWLYSLNHYLFESPIAWYTTSHRLYMKPGLSTTSRLLPALPMQANCMRCHMSAVQPSVPGSLNLYHGLPFLHGGITCEACHGDTTRHVATGGIAPVVNPAMLTPEKRDSICISCHLEGDVAIARAGQSILNFRPGDSISKFLAYYVYTQSNPLARGVSEVEQFNQSMCKRMSGAKMSCTTCHDPHYDPPPTQVVAYYRSKCLQCHNSATFLKTHHPDNPNCIGCHMPHTTANDIAHVAWTDHRILARPPIPETTVDSTATSTLKPIFSPGATQRDLGMAYYKAWLNGNRVEGAKAWSILNPLAPSLQNDVPALNALGILGTGRNDYKSATADFRRVLTLQPHNLTALSDLAVILAKQGHINRSEKMLQLAFTRNQDVVGLAMNLARIECMQGDVAGVQSTLRTSLLYNPGIQQMRQFIQQAPSACQTQPAFTPIH
jgi:predicted CXXCH cytochrome family protein